MCRDTDGSKESGDQVEYRGGTQNLKYSVVDFRRSIFPLDKHDAPIPFAGSTQVFQKCVVFVFVFSHKIYLNP